MHRHPQSPSITPLSMGWDKGQERSLTDYHQRQNRLYLGILIECLTNKITSRQESLPGSSPVQGSQICLRHPHLWCGLFLGLQVHLCIPVVPCGAAGAQLPHHGCTRACRVMLMNFPLFLRWPWCCFCLTPLFSGCSCCCHCTGVFSPFLNVLSQRWWAWPWPEAGVSWNWLQWLLDMEEASAASHSSHPCSLHTTKIWPFQPNLETLGFLCLIFWICKFTLYAYLK